MKPDRLYVQESFQFSFSQTTSNNNVVTIYAARSRTPSKVIMITNELYSTVQMDTNSVGRADGSPQPVMILEITVYVLYYSRPNKPCFYHVKY